MARYTGPKNRLARREGSDLGLKTTGSLAQASLLRRLKILPGQHGQKGRRKTSEYGIQLREKQKAKRIYGILEKQFRRYFEKAAKKLGNTGETLIINLERRLDNVVYRLGLAPTRAAARQFVGHGHVMVDGKKLSIPSYEVLAGQVIQLSPRLMETVLIKKLLDDKNANTPGWLTRKGPVGKVLKFPERKDVQEDINEQLIIEFYSR